MFYSSGAHKIINRIRCYILFCDWYNTCNFSVSHVRRVLFHFFCFVIRVCNSPISYFVVGVRLIFWTEWLRSHRQAARIGRALGDGSNVTYIRTSQLGWPNGLVVDIKFRRIWWCDALFDRYGPWFSLMFNIQGSA